MRSLGLLGLVLWLFSCAQEEARPPFGRQPVDAVTHTSDQGGPMREALQRGLDEDEVLHCDIRAVECQERVFDAAVEARGNAGPRPPVSVATAEEFAAMLEGGSSEAERYARRLLALLHLSAGPFDAGEDGGGSLDALLAVYFSEDDRVVVIDHGRPLDSVEATLTLAHEFVHALQDAEHDLTRLREDIVATDENQGLLGLVEGEAETYASLVVTSEVNEDRGFFRRLRRAVLEAALASPEPFFVADLNFPYTYGTEFATVTWLEGGDEALAAYYDAVPGSSREILAGFGAEPPVGGWVEPITDTALGTIAPGFEPVIEDAFGAFIAHLFLEALAFEAGDTNVRLPQQSAAMDLRGDHVLAFERDGSLVVVWRMRFEPQVAPADVVAEIETHAPGEFVLRVEDGDLLLFAGENRAARDQFAAAFALPPPGTAAPRAAGLPRVRVPSFRACALRGSSLARL